MTRLSKIVEETCLLARQDSHAGKKQPGFMLGTKVLHPKSNHKQKSQLQLKRLSHPRRPLVEKHLASLNPQG